MRKNFLLTVCMVLFAGTLLGQYKPFRLGFKASPTLGWLNANDVGMKSEGVSIGFNGGFVAEINFTENYMILTGINYNYSKGKLSYSKGKLSYQDTDTRPSQYKYDVNQAIKFQYIDIPIALKLRTNEFGICRFFGLMGINSSFCFSAKSDKIMTCKNESKEIKKEDVRNDFTLMKESLMLGIGTDIRVDKSSFISVGLQFHTALNNIAKFKYYHEGNERKAKTTLSYFELQIAFMF